MISAWHLLWIIPVAATFGMFVMTFMCATHEEEG